MLTRRSLLRFLGLAPVAAVVAPAVAEVLYGGRAGGEMPLPLPYRYGPGAFDTYPFDPYRGGGGTTVWPIEEYLARTAWTPDMVASIKRQNPDGKVEGDLPRGVTNDEHLQAVRLFRQSGRQSTFDYEGWRAFA